MYADKQAIPSFLGLRLVTGERLLATHRRHSQTEMRVLGQEVSLNRR